MEKQIRVLQLNAGNIIVGEVMIDNISLPTDTSSTSDDGVVTIFNPRQLIPQPNDKLRKMVPFFGHMGLAELGWTKPVEQYTWYRDQYVMNLEATEELTRLYQSAVSGIAVASADALSGLKGSAKVFDIVR